MFHFANPEWMVLLLLPFIVRRLFARRIPAGRSVPVLYHPQAEEIGRLYRDRVRRRYSWRWLRRYGIWCCLALALMRPELVDRRTEVTQAGYDIMLAVDLSRSMLALDFATEDKMVTRLDVVKEVMGRFITRRSGDRMGLIFFGGHAYLQSPLTLDNRAVAAMLERAQIGMAGDATAIGDAMALGVKKLRHRPPGSRVLILLTDGSSNAGNIPPVDAARIAAEYGIRIYTIGVGSKGQVPYPDQGRIVMVRMDQDDALLQSIAGQTGGAYFSATDLQSLEAVYAAIDRLEKSEAETRSLLLTSPLYRAPLAAALVGIMAIMLAPVTAGFMALCRTIARRLIKKIMAAEGTS